MTEAVQIFHSFEPIYDKNSRVLILGTMPSPKSREVGFYYSNPQNRFWKVMSMVLGTAVPMTPSDKKAFLLQNKIAVWDVLHSCYIKNADDSSISEPVANDISGVLQETEISAVFTTGRKATALYNKYCCVGNNPKAIYLPSTSPANCGIKIDALANAYGIILDYLV